MDRGEFQAFVMKLKGFYGERFPGLTDGMAKLWFECLRYTDEDIAERALVRWARQFTWKSPSLDELQEQVEYIQQEERAHQRRGSSTASWLDVLKNAAAEQADNPLRSEDDATYGQLMALLAERSLEPWFDTQGQQHPKLTVEQRAEQCLVWARKYGAQRPQLAEDLHVAARQFGMPMALLQGRAEDYA